MKSAGDRAKRLKRSVANWTLTIVKLTLTIVSLAVALLPFWVFLLTKHLLNPQGFWEKFAVFAGGIVVGGGFQLFLLIIWLIFLVKAVWTK